MADVSNRTLALLMVAAIVVSLGGLFVSLDRLAQIQSGVVLPGLTGFQTAPQVGRANVSIESSAVLTIVDQVIEFGQCTPPTIGVINITSNNTNGGGYCLNGVYPDFVYLRNDGNQYLNVTMKTNVSARNFLGASTSNGTAFYFTSRVGTGCVNNVIHCPTDDCDSRGDDVNFTVWQTWRNISASEFVEHKACMNLTFGGGLERNFSVYARIDIPDDLQAGYDRRAALNFTGYVLT